MDVRAPSLDEQPVYHKELNRGHKLLLWVIEKILALGGFFYQLANAKKIEQNPLLEKIHKKKLEDLKEISRPGNNGAGMQKLFKLLDAPIDAAYQDRILQIRRQINEILKKGQEQEVNEYLQNLCYAMKTTASLKVDGSGHSLKLKGKVNSFKDFAKILQVRRATGRYARYNTTKEKIVWFITNPRQGARKILSIIAKAYDPYADNNYDIATWQLTQGEKRLTFCHGPTQTGDRLFSCLVGKKEMGIIYHNLQNPKKHGAEGRLEGKNVEFLQRIRDNNRENVTLFSTILDDRVLNNDFEFSTIDALAQEYKEFIKNHGGFDLTDHFNELDQAINAAKESFETIDIASIASVDKKRISRLFQLVVQGHLSVIILLKTFKKSAHSETLFLQACKQDIDRGGAINVVTRVLLKLALHKDDEAEDDKAGAITQDDYEEMLGIVENRASSHGRQIIQDYFDAVKDFFELMQENDLKKATQSYVDNYVDNTDEKMAFQRV